MTQIIKAYDRLIAGLNENIRGLKAYPRILTKPEDKHLHKVFDKALFNALCNLDLITELKYLDVSHALGNKSEANFFARVTAHSCFEILDNLHATIGKEVIQLVEGQLGRQALSDLNTQIKELNQIKKRHISELKSIRNNLFGHRMKAGHQQAEQMLLIKPKAMYDIGRRIFYIEVRILTAFVELLKKM